MSQTNSILKEKTPPLCLSFAQGHSTCSYEQRFENSERDKLAKTKPVTYRATVINKMKRTKVVQQKQTFHHSVRPKLS